MKALEDITCNDKHAFEFEFNYVLHKYGNIYRYDAWVYADPQAVVILEWCDSNFSGEWSCISGTFYFDNKDDYTMFLLRWG